MFFKEWLLNTDKITNIDKTPDNDQTMAPFASVQRKTLDYLNPHNDMSNILKQSNIKSKIKANNELNGGGKNKLMPEFK